MTKKQTKDELILQLLYLLINKIDAMAGKTISKEDTQAAQTSCKTDRPTKLEPYSDTQFRNTIIDISPRKKRNG
jgi:hypothetical protein